jgi:hypothetical protein
MKYLRFFGLGIFFGLVLTKAEIISWYRIFEMFRFESFHMYGVIGSAVILGIIITVIIKRSKMKSMDGTMMYIPEKAKNYKAALFGGSIFGLGWALTGACPGPIYIIIGNGYVVFLMVLLSAIAGTFAYGMLKDKLPH